MTEIILNNNVIDKDSKKKKQIFIAQEHQDNKLSLNNNSVSSRNSNSKDEPDLLSLENEWSFWEDHYINNNNSVASIDEYLNALQQLNSFSTIQDFWNNFNNIPSISKLPNNSCFHLFKKGTRPIWEENLDGGEFVLKVKKVQTDEVWNELVLSVIGEQFSSYLQDNDDICGISIRKKQGLDFNMIHIWNKNIKGKEQIPRAIKCLFPLLLDGCIHSYYKEHSNSSSFSNQSTIAPGNRLSMLKNLNKSTSSVLNPTSVAFIPKKSVRFNLSKSKSESVISSPKLDRKMATEKILLKPSIQIEEAPIQVEHIKPILSKRTANIPVSFDTITDLKPKEINFQKLNKQDQGIVDELDEKLERKEMEQQQQQHIQKKLQKQIENEVLERRQSKQQYNQEPLNFQVDDEFDDFEDILSDDLEEEEEDQELLQRELEENVEKEILKRRQSTEQFDQNTFNVGDKQYQKDLEQDIEKQILKLNQSENQFDQLKHHQKHQQSTTTPPKISFNFDPVLENDKLNHLDEFNLVDQIDKEIQQENELAEAKKLVENDLVADKEAIDEKLECERLKAEMEKDIDIIVDELPDNEVEQELNEQIDSWEQEAGINDPNHEFREQFKRAYKKELKDELREDIKESVLDEIDQYVHDYPSLGVEDKQHLKSKISPPRPSALPKLPVTVPISAPLSDKPIYESKTSPVFTNVTPSEIEITPPLNSSNPISPDAVLFDTLSDKPTIE